MANPLIPINFDSLPPFQFQANARQHIFDLALRPWGDTVTLEAISSLFEYHLDWIELEAFQCNDTAIREKICFIGLPLKEIVSRLVHKFQGSAEKVALRALGAAHWLEALSASSPNTAHPLNQSIPEGILKQIFFELEPSDHGSIRGVSKKWRRIINDVWNDSTKNDWLTVKFKDFKGIQDQIETMYRLHSRCDYLDLRQVERWDIPKLLKLYPHLIGLKQTSYVKTYHNGYNYSKPERPFPCPNLMHLTLNNYGIYNELDLSRLEKLTYAKIIDFNVGSISFPPHIEKIKLIRGQFNSIEFNDTSEKTSIKSLKINFCSTLATLDLTDSCYASLEKLEIINCRFSDLRLNKEYKKLRYINIQLCDFDHIDLSEIHMPELLHLRVGNTALTPPSYYLAPKLQELSLYHLTEDADLSLSDFQSLHILSLSGFTIERLIIPENLRKLTLQDLIIHDLNLREELPYLEYCSLESVIGMPDTVSLASSLGLQSCIIGEVLNLSTLILPGSLQGLNYLEIYQSNLFNLIGLKGDLDQLTELYLSGAPIMGFDILDLMKAANLKALYLNEANTLKRLSLPLEEDNLHYLAVENFNIDVLDVSRYGALEELYVYPLEECVVILGPNNTIKAETYSMNVTVIVKNKKQRTKSCCFLC